MKIAEDVLLYTTDSSMDEFVNEVIGHVSAVGYRWVWLTSVVSVEKAERKALQSLRWKASQMEADAVMGIRTSVTFFPGFLMFRGCVVHLSGTSVTFEEESDS